MAFPLHTYRTLLLALALPALIDAVQGQVGVTTFGIQAKPVIPFRFFDPLTTAERPNVRGEIELDGGFAFGMSVRVGITNAVSLETGIGQIQRRYDFRLMNDTSGYVDGD